jgi:dipeptidyl aminopeptidase/acylaminoacyl peptidase
MHWRIVVLGLLAVVVSALAGMGIGSCAEAAGWEAPLRPSPPVDAFRTLAGEDTATRHGRGVACAYKNVGFSFGRQEHAANDYVVLYTNPRGSAGYGHAFGNAIKRAYPGKDFDDLMRGVDEVTARGYIDERNMFVFGGSGGGVLTSWIVGHTDRFAAASVNFPVIDWLSFVGTTDGAGWYRNFDRYPWEDPSEYLRRSPLMYAGNVKTPTMLMTGVKDLRTPISQTEEFYMALKVQKVPTVMLRFNEEWHGTSSKPSNFMRSQLYLRSWFDKYTTKDGEPVAATDRTN